MASTPKWFDRVQETSTTTGTGTYTLAAAVTGFRTFGSVLSNSESAFYCATEVDGNGNPSGGWEVGLGTWSTGGTLSRDEIRASSNAGAAVSWAAGTRRIFLVSPADFQTYGGLVDQAGPANADQTMEVGARYNWDISGFSADRTATLPAVAKVGQRCEIFLTAGDDAFRVIVTAASGDTLIGSRGSVAGGTAYTHLFTTGERLVFRCIVANSTWVVDVDGRIPMVVHLALTTETDLTQTANTYFLPTDHGGAWTATGEVGDIATESTSLITARRACKANVVIQSRSRGNIADTNYTGCIASLNNTTPTIVLYAFAMSSAAVPLTSDGIGVLVLAAGDTLQFMARNQAADLGQSSGGFNAVRFDFQEIL